MKNTGEENFLRYSPSLKTGSDEWRFLQQQFEASCVHRDKAPATPSRVQDRNKEAFPNKMGTFHEGEFNNEPDTDWALAANRKWAESIRGKWHKTSNDEPIDIPLVIGGEEIYADRDTRTCIDPNQAPYEIPVAIYRLGKTEDADRAVAVAKDDPDGWRKLPPPKTGTLFSLVSPWNCARRAAI